MSPARPGVAVIVPFAGDGAAAAATLERLRTLRLGPGDEVIVADNSPDGSFPAATDGIRVVRATREASSYHARNVGAEHATAEWLLFIDSDCRPASGLLDDHFAPAPGERCGLVAGAVVPDPGQDGLAPRYARSRGHLREDWHARGQPGWPHPSGVTGNLMVRAAAWREAGGFHEGIVSGGDVELCWRLQDAGWGFEWRPDARVEHAHVETVAAMVRQTHRHAAGRRWLARRYPGAFQRPRLAAPLARCAAGALVWAVRGDLERSRFKLLDARWHLAGLRGYLTGDNRPPGERPSADGGVALAAVFPEPGDRAPRVGPRVEALRRPARVDRALARELSVGYAEDDPPLARLRCAARLVLTHPLRAARARRRAALPLAALAPVALRTPPAGPLELLDPGDPDLAATAALAGRDSPDAARAPGGGA